MLQIVIDGRKYDVGAALARASLWDLAELKRQTGMGMKTVLDGFGRYQTAAGSAAEDSMAAFLDDEQALLALGAVIWLARRRAGEKLTLEEACDFPLSEIDWITDEPEVTPPNPPAHPSGPGPGGAADPPVPPAGLSSRSTTSKRRSSSI